MLVGWTSDLVHDTPFLGLTSSGFILPYGMRLFGHAMIHLKNTDLIR